mmetsp:Transcript_88272/g.252438  ORF Transcript_88272/g.252438 Transcript_88272/m.252438 type:complete len:210 (+) Transcript_88272:561-1190(+)
MRSKTGGGRQLVRTCQTVARGLELMAAASSTTASLATLTRMRVWSWTTSQAWAATLGWCGRAQARSSVPVAEVAGRAAWAVEAVVATGCRGYRRIHRAWCGVRAARGSSATVRTARRRPPTERCRWWCYASGRLRAAIPRRAASARMAASTSTWTSEACALAVRRSSFSTTTAAAAATPGTRATTCGPATQSVPRPTLFSRAAGRPLCS